MLRQRHQRGSRTKKRTISQEREEYRLAWSSHSIITRTALCCLAYLAVAATAIGTVGAESESPFPPFSRVTATVQRHFAKTQGWQAGHLISRGDVKPIFAQLKQLGWTASDQDEILAEMLGSNDFLVRTFRSRRGARFMQQVSGYKTIYDRLDRLAAESGGQRMIQGLIKLPDGAKYAKRNPGRGIPSMMEFLPKRRSGKSRKVADYGRPTDKIYTQKQLLQRLERSYQADSRRSQRSQ